MGTLHGTVCNNIVHPSNKVAYIYYRIEISLPGAFCNDIFFFTAL